jgi:predicted anti-sigma-YlaC factor YlaD
MDCDRCRAAISAGLDAEETGLPDDVVHAHMETCASCRSFAAEARSLHRVTRVTEAEPVPDLTGSILRAIGHEPRAVNAEERTRFLRITLAVVAIIQLAMAVPALILGDDAGLPTHVARHLGSFSLALGVGLLVVAWKPERAAGVLPIVAAVVICLLGSSFIDIVSGRAAPGSEVSHAPELVGLVAVWLLARDPAAARGPRPRPVLG